MSLVLALDGTLERLRTVAGLPLVDGQPHVRLGWPTSAQNDVLVFVYFDRASRPPAGQVLVNKYVLGIRAAVKLQDDTKAELALAPLVNSIPAAFDKRNKDGAGHPFATLGGRVNLAEITDIRSGQTDGFIDIGGTLLRSVLFELTVTAKSAVGSGQ